jgi:hypothetical protein
LELEDEKVLEQELEKKQKQCKKHDPENKVEQKPE